MKKIAMLLSIALLFSVCFGEEEQKMEYEKDYLPQLKVWKDRADVADKGIKEQEAKIAELNSQIESTKTETDNVWNEIYALVGSDKAGIEEYRNQLADLEKSVRAFGALPNEEMYKRKAELDQFEEQLKQIGTDKRSSLTEFMNKIASIERNIKSVRSSIVVPYVTSYVVKKGDSLWKISGKNDIYNDPFKWTDIYKANKETIRSWQSKYNAQLKEGQQEADLIYPEQEFTIPR